MRPLRYSKRYIGWMLRSSRDNPGRGVACPANPQTSSIMTSMPPTRHALELAGMNRRDTIRLAMLPTPFEKMPRLSQALGRMVRSIDLDQARRLHRLCRWRQQGPQARIPGCGCIKSRRRCPGDRRGNSIQSRSPDRSCSRAQRAWVRAALNRRGQEPWRGLPDQRECAARPDLRRGASYLARKRTAVR